MTHNDMQRLIDFLEDNITPRALEVYDEDTKTLSDISIVHRDELMKLLQEYHVEEEKCTASLDYEAEYRRCSAQVVDLKGQISILKDTEEFVKNRLAKYEGAVAMAELIYGRKFIV